MKKWAVRIVAIFVAALMVFSIILVAMESVSAAEDPNFVIENGILKQYIGTDEEVNISDSVYYIGDEAFLNNDTVKTINLTDNVIYIGDSAFMGCENLSVISGTDNILRVGLNSFSETLFLNDMTGDFKILNKILISYVGVDSEITIPEKINMIAPGAFFENENIQSVIINDKVVEIGESAFCGCTELAEISIPATVTTIGRNAFIGTKWFDDSADESEFLIEGDGILLRYTGSNTDVMFPKEVKQIAPSAFEGSDITSVKFTNNIYMIGSYAFFDCDALERVFLPNKPIFIDEYAFAKCEVLHTFSVFQNSIMHIDETTFENSNNVRIFAPADSNGGEFAIEKGIELKRPKGDVNLDGDVTISDVTFMQRFLANLVDFDEEQLELADFDCNSEFVISDVTGVQKFLANLEI